MKEMMSGMSFVGSKLYSANKLGLNTCFREHGVPGKNDAQLSCFLSNFKAWGVNPLFDGPAWLPDNSHGIAGPQ